MPSSLITHIRRYVSIDDAQESSILSAVRPIALKKSDYLVREGSPCHSNYFVDKGCVRVFFLSQKDTEQIIQFAMENWWVSDYMSLAAHRSAQFSIQAVETSTVYALEQNVQDRLLEEVPVLEKYFRLILLRATAAAQVRIKYLYDFSKEERYLHFARQYPGFVQRIPQYMLASSLGFTPEYLSEIRKKH